MTDKNYIYTPLAEPTPISEQVWPEGTIPLVATSTLTYNHEPYIRDCLDGILMQKTTFPVRVVVFEDCSTDATREIVKEYQEKYPNLFVTVFAPHNTYGKPERREALKPYFEARAVAKYIALCEGDDYWTDPLKLQKQVEFLERNEGYSMCFHNADIINESEDIHKIRLKQFNHLEERDYSGEEIATKWSIPTASTVFRNYHESPPRDKRLIFGDTVLFVWLSEKGKLHCMGDIMSVYRITKSGVTEQKRDYHLHINHCIAFDEIFNYRYTKVMKRHIVNTYIGAFIGGKLGSQSWNVLNEIIQSPKYITLFLLYLPSKFIRIVYNKIIYLR